MARLKLTDEMIYQAQEEGLSIAETAKKYGLNYYTVRQRVRRLGITLRNPKFTDKETEQDVVNLRAIGHTFEFISEATGLSKNGIRAVLKRRPIPVTPQSTNCEGE